MSGPVVPPLEVTEVDGSPDGRPITKIIVSNGDLSISGREATIDTSGSATVPGTPAKAVQFNSDPAGTFTGSDRFIYESTGNLGRLEMATGLAAQQVEIRAMDGHGLYLASSDLTGGTSTPRNTISIYGENDATDGIYLDPTGTETVKIGGGGLSTPSAASDLIISTYDDEDKAKITLEAGADGDILIQTDNTGVLQLANTTTDADSIFTVLGNGTGTPKVKLENGSMAVQTICEANKKLTIEGGNGGDTFVFDVSSASGGVTFPDGTEQTTAASGGSSFTPVLPDTAIEAASASDMAVLSGYPPWGNGNNSASTLYGNVNGDKIYLYPFIAPSTITITNLEIYISTASTNPCDGLVGIFTDSSGSPGTLIGKSSVSVATTGAKVMTAFLDSGDSATDIDLVDGTQYWFGFGRDTADEGFSFYGSGSYAKPMVCMVSGANFGANSHTVLRTIAATLAMPASFTATNLEPFGNVAAMTAIIN